MFKLNKIQRKHLPAILWLTNPLGNRAEGRTTLMAHAFISHALSYPETRIDVRDHYPNRQSNFRLMRMIQNMIADSEFLRERLMIGPDWVISNRKEKLGERTDNVALHYTGFDGSMVKHQKRS